MNNNKLLGRITRRRVLFVQEEVDRAMEARFRREAPAPV